MIFRGTVSENIALGDPDASAERVQRAAVLAGADGFVRGLPEGYATRGRGRRAAPLRRRAPAARAGAGVPARRAARRARRADRRPRPRQRADRPGGGRAALPRPDGAPDRASPRARGDGGPGRAPRARAGRRPGGGTRMTTARRLLALTGASRGRTLAAAGLGAATVLCGVGLLATSGYLISRAAEHPAVLSLDPCDRRRPLLRPRPAGASLPRAAQLARSRPAGARPRPRPRLRAPGAARSGPSSRASGTATFSLGWSRTSTRSRTSICAASRRRSSRSSAGRRLGRRHGRVPARRRRSCSPSGLVVAAIAVPAAAVLLGRQSARREAADARRPVRGARRARARRARARRLRTRRRAPRAAPPRGRRAGRRARGGRRCPRAPRDAIRGCS